MLSNFTTGLFVVLSCTVAYFIGVYSQLVTEQKQEDIYQQMFVPQEPYPNQYN